MCQARNGSKTHESMKLITSSVCSSVSALDTGPGDAPKSDALVVATVMVGVISIAEKVGEHMSSVRAPKLGLGDLDIRNVGVLSLISIRSIYSGSSAPGVASAFGIGSGGSISGLNVGAGGSTGGLGTGPPRFIIPDATALLERCFLMASFSALKAVASVSVCSIISRRRAMSISSSLV